MHREPADLTLHRHRLYFVKHIEILFLWKNTQVENIVAKGCIWERVNTFQEVNKCGMFAADSFRDKVGKGAILNS